MTTSLENIKFEMQKEQIVALRKALDDTLKRIQLGKADNEICPAAIEMAYELLGDLKKFETPNKG